MVVLHTDTHTHTDTYMHACTTHFGFVDWQQQTVWNICASEVTDRSISRLQG